MTNYPSGVVTFLFTDIEGSTQLWQREPKGMYDALLQHDALLQEAVAAQGGYLFKKMGDAICAAFSEPSAALRAAIDGQRALLSTAWTPLPALRVRMALHQGSAELHDGDYFGLSLSRVARLLNAGHGGQILISEHTAVAVRSALPAKIHLRDLGQHKLKDLQRPEGIFQVELPDFPTTYPPLRTLEHWPNNLPAQLTSFIGREAEIDEAERLLANTRLLTLVGSGGAGKTRLALQVAAEEMEHYSDGVWLVELAAVSTSISVSTVIATTLGVTLDPSRPALSQLAEALAPRRQLLILDNCEHLLDACAEVVAALLQRAQHLRILATSREPLHLVGEVTFRTPSLTYPDDTQALTPAIVSQYEAVRLFIERALAVDPHFRVTNENAPAIAQICSSLDGIPLALELAAARLRALTPEQIAARLVDRFRLLTGGSRTVLPRQQTLQAVIDWSYQLLTNAERILFRRLAIFVGGWSLPAAEAICCGGELEEWEILDLLTALVDKSLVVSEPGAAGQQHYRLLQTIRQYAGTCLQHAGEELEYKDRHQVYYTDWAWMTITQREQESLLGSNPAECPSAQCLQQEKHNLLAAIRTAVSGDVAQSASGVTLFLGTHDIIMSAGSSRDCYDLLNDALADMPPTERLQFPESIQVIFRETGLPFTGSVRAAGLCKLATIVNALFGDLPAKPYVTAALEIYRVEDDWFGEAYCLAALEQTAEVLGEYAEAETLAREAEEAAEKAGATTIKYKLIYARATMAIRLGEFAKARQLLETYLQGSSGIEYYIGFCVAYAAYAEGDLATARGYCERAIDYFDAHGGGAFISRRVLGDVAREEGHFAEARELYRQSQAEWGETASNPQVVLLQLECCAYLAAAQDHPERAVQLLGAAMRLRDDEVYPRNALEFVDYNRYVPRLRAALGEEAFATHLHTGRGMSNTAALALAASC